MKAPSPVVDVGFPARHGGTPIARWMVYEGKSCKKMDDFGVPL